MTTTIVFIRHAQAEERKGGEDSARPLTPKGREIQKRMAELLKKKGYIPNIILCSPYIRTQQTADIIAEVMPTEIEVQPALAANDFDENFIIARLNPPYEKEVFYIVGHEPSLSTFVQDLVGEPCLKGFDKSGAAIIQFDKEIIKNHGRFIAYYKPN